MLKITGLKLLARKLADLSHKVEELEGEHAVPIDQVLTPMFVSKHTRFATAAEMFAASGLVIHQLQDLAHVPDEEWNRFICTESTFPDWDAMLTEAGVLWASRRLGF